MIYHKKDVLILRNKRSYLDTRKKQIMKLHTDKSIKYISRYNIFVIHIYLVIY